ncbi:MAG: hypothetical protein JNL36_07040 [Candidatus Kapabacteria bacterium]|nr:hypothetical protein [Candidatus Kapabacteria bacterium]
MSKTDYNEVPFHSLLQVVAEYIQPLQRSFDIYQQEYFLKRPPEFFALELCGEAGELANKEKKLWKGKDISLEELSEEAADVVIALFNYANSRNINLAEALVNKLEKIQPKP